MSFEFGKKAKDKVTGFEGIITGRCIYMYGCDQYLLMPAVDKDGKMQDGKWFDDGRIVITGEGLTEKEVASPSGRNGCDNDNMPEAR